MTEPNKPAPAAVGEARQLSLTCRCGAKNMRSLPYGLNPVDWCEACGMLFGDGDRPARYMPGYPLSGAPAPASHSDLSAREDDWAPAAAMYTLDAADAPPRVRDTAGQSVEHASWMLHEIINGRIVGRKAHRWLGYAQGLLVAGQRLDLEEAKQANKRASDEVPAPANPEGDE